MKIKTANFKIRTANFKSGQLVQPILVKPKLEEIFNYRTKKLEELFGTF